jgi:phytoene dehydrogenase-like protein
MMTTIATPYARAVLQDNYDAVVVGSGIGGLGAAALLAKHGGKRVLVLERHYTVGGYTHTFHRPGYEWDVGVHYIGEMHPGAMLRRIFDDVSDGSLEWADMGPVYDRVAIGGDLYEFPKGEENLKAALKQWFPGEATAIDRYFELVHQTVASAQTFFMEKALPRPLAALAGGILRHGFLKLAGRTTREVLESLTGNQRLIAVLTGQCGDYGLPPAHSSFGIHALVARHYFEGGYYPVGGAGRIAASILPVIESAGGQVLINADVSEVVLEHSRAAGVRMARDGRVIRAPLVVSDAGVANTFAHLVPADVAARAGFPQNLRRLQPSIGHLCLYVGLSKTARELALPRANLWVYPNERHEETFAAALNDADGPSPLVYVSFPSAKDPDFERRHPGRATIDIITLAPYERFAAWEARPWKKRGVEYDALKERLALGLLATLYTHLPQVKGAVDVYELSTPLTTRHFANYGRGELYGIDHTPQRFRQRFLRPRTPIRGLYLTGQDVSSCGVAGALIGGVLSASAILGRNLMGAIVKAPRATPAPPREHAEAACEVTDSAA